jgi:nitrogen PTS system EIIA component
MNRIAHLLTPNKILLGLAATSKKRLFEQVSLMFENENSLNRATTFDALFQRERLGSTGLGEGVAIPHGRIKGLKDAQAAVVRLENPLPFEAHDDQPVRLLIFLLVPERAKEEHLELLSELAELLSDEAARNQMLTDNDPQILLSHLKSWAPGASQGQ